MPLTQTQEYDLTSQIHEGVTLVKIDRVGFLPLESCDLSITRDPGTPKSLALPRCNRQKIPVVLVTVHVEVAPRTPQKVYHYPLVYLERIARDVAMRRIPQRPTQALVHGT